MKINGFAGLAEMIVLLCVLSVMTPSSAMADDDQAMHPSCAYCGMDRTTFAHSRMLIAYDDDTTLGTCSLHCAAIDLSLKIDTTPVGIRVADYNTRRLIDAETAHWVTGGDLMGVMTSRAKWAFASREGALAFVSARGGSTADFKTAVKAAFEDMYADLHMIRNKRKKMRAMQSE